MPALFFRVLFFCLILSGFSKLSFALENKTTSCQIRFEPALQILLKDIDQLEALYIRYRWIEAKTRLLTYHDLWTARYQSLDPLDREMRAGGNAEEDRILNILEGLDAESEEKSNAFWNTLKEMKARTLLFEGCCPEKNYKECIDRAFLPVFDKIQTGRPLFDGIFERERDYRKEVELTAGSRKGLYPEDAIEDKAKHEDFFKRYEMERRAQRFRDDEAMMSFFQDLRKMLTVSFPGAECCHACGKTNWEAKVDQMFRES